MTSNENDQLEVHQQLFADTLLKLQIHSALANENIHRNKSPLPLLAQSCSLLDNISSVTMQNYWTPAQRELIASLKIETWSSLANECIRINDLIQAEASLQRLAILQDATAGPFSRDAQKTKSNHIRKNKKMSTVSDSTSDGNDTTNPTSPELVEQYRQAASGLIQTWDKLRQVYTGMGKMDMANNYGKRIQKMTTLLNGSTIDPSLTTIP